MFGREVNLPLDISLGNFPEVAAEIYVEQLQQNLEEAYARVREKTTGKIRRQKRNFDRFARGGPYKAGDVVWLFNTRREKGRCRKFRKPWVGPYMVVRRLSDVNYRIQRSKRAKPSVVHFDRLKPYRGDTFLPWALVPGDNPIDPSNETPATPEVVDESATVDRVSLPLHRRQKTSLLLRIV